MDYPESKLLRHEGCPACGSSDARAVYDDGHTHCFSCNTTVQGDGPAPERDEVSIPANLVPLRFAPLLARGITTDRACRKMLYGVGTYGGEPCQVACLTNDKGDVVAQKLRFKDKRFMVLGSIKQAGMFGQSAWQGSGKYVVITEGEIDALSYAHVTDSRWPVVSLKNGASGAASDIAAALPWLDQFERVVLMFDSDPAGQEAAQAAAEVLPPGKAFIARLPLKDANEMLVAGRGEELAKAVFNARPWRPDGVLGADEVLSRVRDAKTLTPIAHYPWAKLEARTRGIFPRQVVVFTAGSGVGKTEIVRYCAYHNILAGVKVGYLGLEEPVETTAVGLVGFALKQRLCLVEKPAEVPGFAEAWERVVNGKVLFYDHFGSLDPDRLMSQIRYMRVSAGCDLIILDHLSIVVSGLEGDNERILIDRIMTKLRTLAEETNCAIVVISHLKRPVGTPHEEGGETSLAQLRGSGSIGQLADVVVGVERNQQDETFPNRCKLRILKNRKTGFTGLQDELDYDVNQGIFNPVAEFSAVPETKTEGPVPATEF